MMFFLNKAEPNGQIKRDEFIRVAKERGIPTMNDAASDATPQDNLFEVHETGIRSGDLLRR